MAAFPLSNASRRISSGPLWWIESVKVTQAVALGLPTLLVLFWCTTSELLQSSASADETLEVLVARQTYLGDLHEM